MGGRIVCAISGLPITAYDEARFLFLTQWNPVRGRLYTNGFWSPMHPPFLAKYDDYGFFEGEDKEDISYRSARDTVLEYTGIDLDGDRGEARSSFCREGWNIIDKPFYQSLRIAGNEVQLAAIDPRVWDAALARVEKFVNYEKQMWVEQVDEIYGGFEARYDQFARAQSAYDSNKDLNEFFDIMREDDGVFFRERCGLPEWNDGMIYRLVDRLQYVIPGPLPERDSFFKLLREVIGFWGVDSFLDLVGLRWMPSRRFVSEDEEVRDWYRTVADIADEKIRLFEEEFG